MGRDLADAYPEARAVFEEVDEALGEPLSAVIWGEDEAALTLTRNAQPALMAVSMAAVRRWARRVWGSRPRPTWRAIRSGNTRRSRRRGL